MKILKTILAVLVLLSLHSLSLAANELPEFNWPDKEFFNKNGRYSSTIFAQNDMKLAIAEAAVITGSSYEEMKDFFLKNASPASGQFYAYDPMELAIRRASVITGQDLELVKSYFEKHVDGTGQQIAYDKKELSILRAAKISGVEIDIVRDIYKAADSVGEFAVQAPIEVSILFAAAVSGKDISEVREAFEGRFSTTFFKRNMRHMAEAEATLIHQFR